MRIGVGLSEDLPLAQQAELARAVEQAGVATLWTNEAAGRDALLVCQAWAAATRTLQVGVAVVPVWSRSPAQLAMAAATLAESSGGRFHLGIGVGHPVTARRWHGAEFRRPLDAAAEATRIVRTLLAGETCTLEGRVFHCEGLRLNITPSPPPVPVYLAAMGPRMRRLAAEHSHGVVLNWSSPAELARAVGDIRAVRPEATVAAYVRVAVAVDPEAARAALAAEFGRYAALDAYARHFDRQGLGAAVGAARAAWRRGGAAAVADAVPADVLAEVGWWGGAGDGLGELLDRYATTGLDHLILRLVPVGAVDASLHRLLAALR